MLDQWPPLPPQEPIRQHQKPTPPPQEKRMGFISKGGFDALNGTVIAQLILKPPRKPHRKPLREEGNENKENYFTFPSGIELELSTDKAAALEWQDNSKTPLELFAAKFPDKTLADIDKNSLRWVQKNYMNTVPIVKIKPEDLDRKISRYFKIRELVRIDPNDKAYMLEAGTWLKHVQFMIHDKDGQYYWNVARIDPNLCLTLDDIRLSAGFALKVDEGVRPYAYNRDMYLAKFGRKKETSPHISGKAVDLSRTGSRNKDRKLRNAIKSALSGKGGGWGYGDTVYHVDVRIQNGANPNQTGSWVIDKKTGKVKLRLRTWPY